MRNIIKTCNKTDENYVFSPLALYQALVLLAQTTSSNSQKEILDSIGLKREDLDKTAEEIKKEFNVNNLTLSLKSSIWLNNQLPVNYDECKKISEINNCPLKKVEMGCDSTNKEIQHWLNTYTHNLLKDSISGINTNKDDLLRLYTAIYFKDRWIEPFEEERTKKSDFMVSKHNKVKCDFMYQVIEDDLFIGKHFKAIKMNMSNTSMFFILPDKRYSPSDIAKDDDYLELMQGRTDKLKKKYYRIHLSLPKFKIKAKSDIIELIKKMGINDVFDMSNADFSPITSSKEVFVQDINQNAVIDVDENGVEAAAYIETNVYCGGIFLGKLKNYELVFDRPFMFGIVKNNNSLFMGTVVDPTK